MTLRKPRRRLLSLVLPTMALLSLWLPPSASAECASFHADPAPGYTGPLLKGIHCSYAGSPIATWTVPLKVTEAEFSLYGSDDSVGGKAGGRVDATLPVVPGQTYVLESGGGGNATIVKLNEDRLLVAGGGNGNEPNYIGPIASDVNAQAPGTPIAGFALDGSIWVSWLVGGSQKPNDPDPPTTERDTCTVPRLKGKRPVAARRSLADARCGVGEISGQPARRAKRNRVIAQSPRPGTRLPADGAVNLIVGRRR